MIKNIKQIFLSIIIISTGVLAEAEVLVVVHGTDGYGSPYTRFVPASEAPYGSEPVAVVRGTDGYGSPTISYVPASQAPHGSAAVVVVRGTDGYGSPSISYVPADGGSINIGCATTYSTYCN
jgi:hypothetical protein